MQPARHSHVSVRALVGASVVLAGLLAALPGCKGTNIISTEEEVRLGRQVDAEVKRTHKVDTTSRDARRVDEMGRKLLGSARERPEVPYSFAVIVSKDVNAVSLPGGPIYVYQGLLDAAGSDEDAVACVIAHELAHINGRHAAKLVSQRYLATAGIGLVLRNKTAIEVAGLAQDLLSLHYSREDEYEADRAGLAYAYRAGFDPRGMVRFFRKLQSLEQQKGSPEFLRTHPVTSSRISRAERIIETRDYPKAK